MIIVLAHQKGGVGKTTTALNLVEIMKPDIIIDQDAHDGISFLNEYRELGNKLNVIHGLDKASMIKTLRQSEQGKTIVVDCGGFDSDVNRVAIALADVVLVPSNDDIKEVKGLNRFNDMLVEISNDLGEQQVGHVFLTRTHPSRKHFEDFEGFVNEMSHLKMLSTRIPTSKFHNIAHFEGVGVTAHQKTKYSDAARDIKALAKEVTLLLESKKDEQ